LVGGGGGPLGTIGNNPDGLGLRWIPRSTNIAITAAAASMSAGTPAVIYDGGLFLSAPGVSFFPATPSATATFATVALVMGSRPDIAVLQPGP
jgi:hypothetical protein